MNALFDPWVQIAWRVTWQSAILALVVMLVAAALRERIAPRWQYLLWFVVLIRLLVVVTPSSPWSAFNLLAERRFEPFTDSPGVIPRVRSSNPRDGVQQEGSAQLDSTESPAVRSANDPTSVQAGATLTDRQEKPSAVEYAEASGSTRRRSTEPSRRMALAPVVALVWFAGCLFFGLRYGIAWLRLRHRLRLCQPVSESATLQLLERAKQKLGVRFLRPQLLVSPEPVSPYVVGTLKPRIVVPESVLETMAPHDIEFILAHELAHVRRGDVWMQWLMIVTQTLHWFNPFSWRTARGMQATREAACDDFVVEQYDGSGRSQYAKTILAVSTHFQPAPLAPGLIGFFHRKNVVSSRVRRLAAPTAKRPLWAWTAAGLVAVLALLGLTDATTTPPGNLLTPSVAQGEDDRSTGVRDEQDGSDPKGKAAVSGKSFAIAGKCLTWKDHSPLAGVTIRLFATRGLVGQPREIARTTSDADGGFEFDPVDPTNRMRVTGLCYDLVADAADRPVQTQRVWGHEDPSQTDIGFFDSAATLVGCVVDEQGRPVVGANVATPYLLSGTVPGLPAAVTNVEGRFVITRLPRVVPGETKPDSWSLRVEHPQHPTKTFRVKTIPGIARFEMPAGCTLTGSVRDARTNRPLSGGVVTAMPMGTENTEVHTVTDSQGRYQMCVAGGNYAVVLEDENLVVKAISDIECRAGTTVSLQPLQASSGGWLAGQVVNTKTGQPMVFAEDSEKTGQPMILTEWSKRIAVGLFGPARPKRRVISPRVLAVVDDEGRFRIRAAAGDNYPYLVNIRGDRMGWDTHKKPPITIKEGSTGECAISITPPKTVAEKMAAARKILDALPMDTEKRVAGIIEEFRKLNHTVDETETWCLLMRELTTIGSAAVPALCKEFEATDEQRMMRRLAFTLRAIGDPRAVPTLIRVLPKTLLPSSSDYGLIVEDPDLTAFMQKHSHRGERGAGGHFSFGRAVREMHSALTRLTKRNVNGRELFGMKRSDDPRSLARQEQYFHEAAEEWATWWEANWEQFGIEASFREVNLPAYDPPDLSDYPTGRELTRNAKVAGGVTGQVLSPVGDPDTGADFFLDLDTGREPRWPKELPSKDGSAETVQAAKEWAAKTGADLMCVAMPDDDGKTTYTLIGVGLQLWEIDPFDAKNIAKRVAEGKLPEGREVKGALMHFDASTNQYVSKRGSNFLYVTREHGLGVITITDFVTEVRNLTGTYSGPPQGVGCHRGVRFNYKSIVR